METGTHIEWKRKLRDCENCTNEYDLGSVWRLRYRAARLSAQHQRGGSVSLGRLQFRRKFSQGLDLFRTMLNGSSS